MDRKYLTHGIEVGLGFIKTYHPNAHMHTPEGRERLTALLVEHLVNNWIEPTQAEPSQEDKIWQRILDRQEAAQQVYEAKAINLDEDEPVASLDLKDADLGAECGECGHRDGWHFTSCSLCINHDLKDL